MDRVMVRPFAPLIAKVISLAVMWHVKYPPSLMNVEDLLHELEIDISYEAVRYETDPSARSAWAE